MAKNKARSWSYDDPTKNVLDLVHAETKRQDDLRIQEFKSNRRELKNYKRYQRDLRLAESRRIDAIRAVDAQAVAVANSAAENRATTLAGQVNAAKDAQVVSMKAETDPIRKDIGDLRQSQWTIAGTKEQGLDDRGVKQASSTHWASWAGIGVAVLAIVVSGFLQSAAIIATVVYMALH